MNLVLPSGLTVKIENPNVDFPRLIAEAEARETNAHDDVTILKKRAKQMEAWLVAPEKTDPPAEPTK